MTSIRPSRVVPMRCAAGGVTQACVFEGVLHPIWKDQLLLNGCNPSERVCCCHPVARGWEWDRRGRCYQCLVRHCLWRKERSDKKSHVIPLTVFRCVTSDRWNHWLFRGPKKSEGIQITCDIVGEPCVGESRVGCAEDVRRTCGCSRRVPRRVRPGPSLLRACTVAPSGWDRHSFDQESSLPRAGTVAPSSLHRRSFEPGPSFLRADAVTCLWGRSGSGSRRRSSCSSRRAPRGGPRPGSRL